MSILRYEHLPALQSKTAPTTVGDAWVLLLGTLTGAFLLGVASAAVMLSATAAWAAETAAVFLLLVLFATPLILGRLVAEPMWKRCRRCYSGGALLTLLLSVALALLGLGVAGAASLCVTGIYCF